MKVRANREMRYMSRMLQVGDEFEATPVDARYLLGDQSVEEVETAEPADKPRRGRPPRHTAAEASAPESAESADTVDEFHDQTVGELREIAEARGLEVHPGYMRRDELVALLRGEQSGEKT